MLAAGSEITILEAESVSQGYIDGSMQAIRAWEPTFTKLSANGATVEGWRLTGPHRCRSRGLSGLASFRTNDFAVSKKFSEQLKDLMNVIRSQNLR